MLNNLSLDKKKHFCDNSSDQLIQLIHHVWLAHKLKKGNV